MILGVSFILIGLTSIALMVWFKSKNQKVDAWDKVNYAKGFFGGIAFILLGLLVLLGFL